MVRELKRSRRTWIQYACAMAGVALLLLPGPALAKDAGFYMGMDLGASIGDGFTARGRDNDLESACDRHFSPDTGDNKRRPTCTETQDFIWTSPFDGGAGVLGGLTLGYRMNNFRGEAEYFYLGTNFDSTYVYAPGATDEEADEVDSGSETIDDVVAHNFFANLYYDVRSDSKWTPYVGAGVGFARVSMDYFSTYQRQQNPDAITTFTTPPGGCPDGRICIGESEQNENGNYVVRDPANENNRDVRRNNLSRTNSIGRSNLTDTVFGYQFIAGLDYQVSDPVTIGVKFRYVSYSEFEDSDAYQSLRGHAPNNAPFGDVDASAAHRRQVRYVYSTDDLAFYGVTINLKYNF